MGGMTRRRFRPAALLIAALLLLATTPASGAEPGRDLDALLADWPHLSGDARERAEARAVRLLTASPEAGRQVYDAAASDAVRATLLRWMSLSGHPGYLPVVHAALERGDERLATVALAAAYTFDRPESAPHVLPYLRASAPTLTAGALRYVSARPETVTPEHLLPLLERAHPGVRSALLRVLGHFPQPPFATYCRDALNATPAGLRPLAVRCLAKQGDPAAVPLLLKRFEHVEVPVQVAIVQAVATLQGREATERLLDWLAYPHPRVALTALVILQGRTERAAVPVLLAQLRRGETVLPDATVIKSLGLFGDPRALDFLGTALNEADDPQRTALLLEAIGDLGAMEGQRYLLDYLSDARPTVRRAARAALRRLAAKNAE